jgi:hypothetical protein
VGEMPYVVSGPCYGRPVSRSHRMSGQRKLESWRCVSQDVDETLDSGHRQASTANHIPDNQRERREDFAGSARNDGSFCERSQPSSRRFLPAFAVAPLRRGILRVSETRLVYRAEARRRRAKDAGPEQRELEPDCRLAAAARPRPLGSLIQSSVSGALSVFE